VDIDDRTAAVGAENRRGAPGYLNCPEEVDFEHLTDVLDGAVGE
jgi:hypothetical protein